MTTVLVEYVGRKARCTDRIAGTKLVWEGNGAVHAVPVAAWEKLSLHPDMWALVDEPASTLGLVNAKQPDPEPDDGEGDTPDIEAKTEKEALRALARQHGIKFSNNAGVDTLRAKLKAAGL